MCNVTRGGGGEKKSDKGQGWYRRLDIGQVMAYLHITLGSMSHIQTQEKLLVKQMMKTRHNICEFSRQKKNPPAANTNSSCNKNIL